MQNIQRAKSEMISEKLTAAFDFSKVNTILTTIYPNSKVPGKKTELWMAGTTQLFPPQNL